MKYNIGSGAHSFYMLRENRKPPLHEDFVDTPSKKDEILLFFEQLFVSLPPNRLKQRKKMGVNALAIKKDST
jgi:hypothetical protein